MKIIHDRRRVTTTSHVREFVYLNEPTAGFQFDSDERGVPTNEHPASRENFAACLTGSVRGEAVRDLGVRVLRHSYTEAAVGACDVCGRHVHLHDHTNTCDGCGADYNGFGQRLADRSQWGEETGEHWSECL